MGREIRRVPPNWQHPKGERRNGEIDYLPMLDDDFKSASAVWKKAYEEWKPGFPNYDSWHKNEKEITEFWEYISPPDRDYYRPAFKPEEATWYQVYETVSEGTPVTPPFATQAELVDYLVKNGDFWDQKRGDGGWNRENAERFVGSGFAMSMIVENGQVKMPRDM